MMGLSHTVSSSDEIALLAVINLSEGDLNFHPTLNCMPFFMLCQASVTLLCPATQHDFLARNLIYVDLFFTYAVLNR